MATMTVFTACLPSDPGQTGELAVRLSDGQVVARLLPCESQSGDTVRAIELVRAGRRDEERPVWALHGALALDAPLDIGVGDSRVGTLTGAPLREPLSPETQYILIVSADRSPPMLNEFSPGDLDEELWLTWTGRQQHLDDLAPYGCR